MLELTVGTAPHTVRCRQIAAGPDLIVVLDGGTHPHVGAVAVAVPRPSLTDSAKTSSSVSVLTMLGHKEDELARLAADHLCHTTGRLTVFTAGLHLDQASGADISLLIQNAETAYRQLAEHLQNHPDLKQP